MTEDQKRKRKRNNKLKAIILAVVAVMLVWIVMPYAGVRFSKTPTVHEGDVIFQMSESDQAPLVAMATSSPLTHCGIIVMKNGKPYVLEASGTLKVTPLKEWISRGKLSAYWLKHPKENDGKISIHYSHLLGRSYDLAFSFDNNKYYCSELVYDIYKSQLGKTLCNTHPVSHYHTLGMKRSMRRRGITMNQQVVAPVDVFKSKMWK